LFQCCYKNRNTWRKPSELYVNWNDNSYMIKPMICWSQNSLWVLSWKTWSQTLSYVSNWSY
jgi:hypothetical protein